MESYLDLSLVAAGTLAVILLLLILVSFILLSKRCAALEKALGKARAELAEIFLTRSDEDSAHVGATWAHGEMVRPLREIIVRTMLFPEYYDCPELSLREPAQDVDPRFTVPFLYWSAVQKPVEKLCHRLRCGGMQDENALGIALQMEKLRLLDICKIFKFPGRILPQEALYMGRQRHQLLGACLEMHVVWSGGAAPGAIVEAQETPAGACEIQHVLETVPDGLRSVLGAGDDQMMREYRERIEGDAVLPALPAFKIYVILLGRPVLRTEETRPGGDGCRIKGGIGRNLPGRVQLDLHLHSAQIEVFHPGLLQVTVVL